MRKIAVHPAFIAFAVFLIATGKSLALFNTVVCCTLHELGHVRAAKTRGYRLNNMVFMPYGAMVTGGETIHKSDEAAISFWGPLVNLAVFAALAACWWLFPESYRFTRTLAAENLAIALFNLLPLYPLDMSRVVIAAAKNKKRALKLLRLAGIAAAVCFFALFIASIFSKINYSLLLSAFMFLSGALSGIKSEVKMYEYNTAFLKDARHPLERKTYRIAETLPLSRVLRLFSPQTVLTIEIVSADGKVLESLEETELVDRLARAPAGGRAASLLSRSVTSRIDSKEKV